MTFQKNLTPEKKEKKKLKLIWTIANDFLLHLSYTIEEAYEAYISFYVLLLIIP